MEQTVYNPTFVPEQLKTRLTVIYFLWCRIPGTDVQWSEFFFFDFVEKQLEAWIAGVQLALLDGLCMGGGHSA